MQFETTKTLVRTDKNGTKIYNVIRPCYRCGGRGILNCYMHVEAGTCFACNGTGREEATEKEYTEEYLERKAARAKAKEDARKAAWNVTDALAKLGYGEYIGIVTDMNGTRNYGDNFEWLVRDGRCKYEKGCSGLLSPDVTRSEITFALMPATEKFLIVPVHWSELLEADYENCRLSWKDGAAKVALKNHTYNFPQAKFESAFVGAEGDKIEINVKLRRVTGFESTFGYTNVYTFEDASHNLIVWKTGKGLDLEAGAYARIAGTIKEHSEFRGEKQTVLTRCKVIAA